MTKYDLDALWPLIHAERASLLEDLAGLTPEQWGHATLCGTWNVEHVVAHLSAAASTGKWLWLRSMIGALFRMDVHNQRRLNAHLGTTPVQTLANFRRVARNTIAPSSDIPAYLGEVVVHTQDIRHPLGLNREPSRAALTVVAEFFAGRDFAVNSKTHAAGLRLEANDGPFTSGTGQLVTGPTLALVMVMAGRPAYLEQLDGPGVQTLRERLEPAPLAP